MLADRDRVSELLGMMSAAEQELVFLWAVERYTAAEPADHLDVPRGTVPAGLHRLEARLRRETSAQRGRMRSP